MEISNVKSHFENGITYLVKNACPEWLCLSSTAIQVTALEIQSRDSHAAELIHQIQVVFNTINVCWICWEFTKILDIGVPIGLTIGTIGVGATLLVITIALPILLNRHFTPTEMLASPKRKGESIRWAPPRSQSFGRALYSARMVTNIALACLSTTSKIQFTLTALGMGYNLIKTSKQKWVEISKKIGENTLYYSALLQTYKGNNFCSICRRDETPDSFFCKEKHPFHSACLSAWFHQKSAQFMDHSSTTISETRHYYNGAYMGTSHAASIQIPENNLPSCPNCRDIPSHSFLRAKREGCSSSTIYITNSTPKWTLWSSPVVETAYTVYNAFQFTLIGLIKTRPEVIANILAMQHTMILSDLAALIRDCMALKESVDHKKLPSKHKKSLIYGAAFFAITAGLAILGLNRRLKLAVDLKNTLVSHLSLSTIETQKISISWARTSLETFSQYLYILRIGLNATSIFYSKNPFIKTVNTALLTLSLSKLSKLPWMRVDQKISSHIPNVGIKEADMSFYFLPSQNALSNENAPSTLKTIYEYTSNIFKGSAWRGWIDKGNLWYNIRLANGINSTLNNIPYLSKVTGKAFSFFYEKNADLSIINMS